MTIERENLTHTALSRQRTLDLLFYTACFVFLYLHLFEIPFTPFYYEADHVNLLNDAKRMTEGEFIYRDFFEFLFPGAHVLYAGLMTIFGPDYWIVSVLTIFHGMAAAFLGISISRRLINDRFAVYLPSALYIFLGFRWFGIDGEHRMFSPLFCYAAVLVLLPARSLPRLIAAAVACAAASFFTQQRGLVTAAAIGLCLLADLGFAQKDWTGFLRSSLIFSAVFVGTLAVMLLPFVYLAGAETFVEHTLRFLIDYAQDPTTNSLQTYLHTLTKVISFGYVTAAVTLFYSVLIPAIYVVALVILWVKRRQISHDTLFGLLLLSSVGLLLALGTSGPNVSRLYQVSLPALVLLVWLGRRVGLQGLTAASLVTILMVFGFALGVRLQTSWDTRTLDTASGRLVFLSPVIAERYEWLLANAEPGDLVFETYNSHVNFPLGLRNPSRMSILLNSGYSPPRHVSWAIEDLKRAKPRYIIWDGAWTPEMNGLSEGEKLKPLFEYMTVNYRLVKAFTPYDGRERQVWERIDARQ